jgi:hypothetical protein
VVQLKPCKRTVGTSCLFRSSIMILRRRTTTTGLVRFVAHPRLFVSCGIVVVIVVVIIVVIIVVIVIIAMCALLLEVAGWTGFLFSSWIVTSAISRRRCDWS